MNESSAVRRGAVASEYPQTPFLLLKKSIPKNNVLAGTDPAQIRFFAERVRGEPVKVDRVTDEMLLGQQGLAFLVIAEHKIDLSPDAKARTGIWSAHPLVRGSSGVNTLIKYAATLLTPEPKLTREQVELVASEIAKDPIEDVRAALWEAVCLLSGPLAAREKWQDPWKDPRLWLRGVDVSHRLHGLYRSLSGWSYLYAGEVKTAKDFGISSSHAALLKELKLDPAKVYEALKLLSAWKSGRSDAHICALRIASLWG